MFFYFLKLFALTIICLIGVFILFTVLIFFVKIILYFLDRD